MFYNLLHTFTEKGIFTLQRLQNYSKRKIAHAKADLQEFSRNAEFRNTQVGKRCFILGNGPSLLKHDLLPLGSEQVFVVNNFYRHQDFTAIKPNYYVFADPDVYRLEVPSVVSWWQEFAEKVKGQNIVFFLPIQLKGTAVHGLLKQEKVYFLGLDLPFSENTVHKFDITETVGAAQNVLILCIQLAIYMGFTEIYLTGADHDWLTNIKELKHFYGTVDATTNGVRETFHTEYSWWVYATNKMFKQYKMVRRYAKDKGVKIYNASEAGLLDIYPPITFKEALGEKPN
jgi:hypothetical protein